MWVSTACRSHESGHASSPTVVQQLTGRPSSGNCPRPSDRAVAGLGAATGAGALGVTGMKCDMPAPPAVALVERLGSLMCADGGDTVELLEVPAIVTTVCHNMPADASLMAMTAAFTAAHTTIYLPPPPHRGSRRVAAWRRLPRAPLAPQSRGPGACAAAGEGKGGGGG